MTPSPQLSVRLQPITSNGGWAVNVVPSRAVKPGDDDTEPPESFALYSPASIHVVYLADRKCVSFETLDGEVRIDVKPEQWEAFWRQMVMIGNRELGRGEV